MARLLISAFATAHGAVTPMVRVCRPEMSRHPARPAPGSPGTPAPLPSPWWRASRSSEPASDLAAATTGGPVPAVVAGATAVLMTVYLSAWPAAGPVISLISHAILACGARTLPRT